MAGHWITVRQEGVEPSPQSMVCLVCWPATTEHEQASHIIEMKILRWSMSVRRLDHIKNGHIRETIGVAAVTEKMREKLLRWYGHVTRSAEKLVAKTALQYDLAGKRSHGRRKKRWLDLEIKVDLETKRLKPEDAFNGKKWQTATLRR